MTPTPANFALDARLDINTAALVRRGLHAEALTMLRLSLHRRIDAAGEAAHAVRQRMTQTLHEWPTRYIVAPDMRAMYLATVERDAPLLIRNILQGG